MDEHVLDAEVQGCPATGLHQGIHVGLVRGVAELLAEMKFDFSLSYFTILANGSEQG